MIGAGAGLSTSAGFVYNGERFEKHFSEFGKKYGFKDAALVRENMTKHDPKSAFLIGNNLPGDVIHEAEQKSWMDLQMRLEI